MRLSNLIPSIPANLVASLEAIGVRTENDLLFSASTFEIYKRLPANSVSLQELINFTSLAAELCAAPGMSASEALRLEKESLTGGDELCSAVEEVDEILRGLGHRKVIELSGDKGSGKSTFALNLVLQHLASHPGSNAVWMDTAGNFSSQQALEILSCKQLDESVLEYVKVPLVFDIDSAQNLLDDLRQQKDHNLQFLVIDAITPLLGPLLSAVSAQGHAIMTDFMRQLQSFAQVSRTTVIVINNTSGHGLEANKRKPALGPSFVLLTDTTLWLQALPNNEIDDPDARLHSIQIVKSRSKPTGGSAMFRVLNGGIFPA